MENALPNTTIIVGTEVNLWTLENIGKVNVIRVPEAIKADARRALDRMLALAPRTTPSKHHEPIQEREAAAI